MTSLPALSRRSLAALVAAVAFASAMATAADSSRPNVLFIVADDLGWSDVGWHGGPGKTPSLDRLVREGVELDRHYVQPVCTPTRAALMTGRYPGRFGPQAIAPSNRRALPPGTVTLASALQSLGYETFQIGKWHLGARPEWGPNAYGFAHSYGTLTGAADPWNHTYRPGPYEHTWHRDGVRIDEEGNATELVTREAERRIRAASLAASDQRKPWLLVVGFHAVHVPVDAPEAFKRLYDGVRFHEDPAKHDSRLRLLAMVAQLDDSVGRLVRVLDETGQRRDTLIVFTSDNGGIESVENHYVSDVPGSPLNSENDPLRGQKNTLWEGGIRVCAVANWPGVLTPRSCRSVIHAADWFPTIAGLVGWKPDRELAWDGEDRWHALTGKAAGAERQRPVCVVHKNGRAVVSERWKLIVRHQGRPQLYDLSTDPFETTDVADAHADVVESLRAVADADARRDLTELPADLADTPP